MSTFHHQESIQEAEIIRLKTELTAALHAKNKAEDEKAKIESQLTMYRNAWKRELGNKFFAKSHEIDALVLTTRYHFERSEKTDDLKKRLAMAQLLIADMMEVLLTTKFTILDIKKGFHWATKPAKWVEQVTAPIKTILNRANEEQPIIAPKS